MKRTWIGFIVLLLFLSACGNTKSAQGEKEALTEDDIPLENSLYENSEYGISIDLPTNWKLEKETSEGKLNVKFTNNHTKAIITAVTTQKTFEEIKTELTLGSGNVEVISNKDDQLSLESKLKDQTRIEIFLKKHQDNTYVFTFMTPGSKYMNEKSKIDFFMENIILE